MIQTKRKKYVVFAVFLSIVLIFAMAAAITVGGRVDGVAEAAFQPLAGITFSDFLNAQYGSGGNSGSANITKGGITFQVGTIKDKGTDYLLIKSMESLVISFSLPQDINNVAITIYAKFELPAGGEIGNGNIRVNENLSNDLATPTAANNWEIANTYRLYSGLFTNANNNIRIWFNTCQKDYKIIDLQFSAKNTTNPGDPTTHTVLFDKNGGSGGADSVEVTNGSAMPTITSLPTRSGYSFKGYYSATSDGTQYYKADGTSAKNWDKNYGSTLYAQWIQSSTVTLNKNNGTGGTNSVVAEPGKAMPTANMPSRTGYTFQGYYDTSATTGGTQYYKADGSSARNWDKTGNQTLWARWTAINYSISYTLNGGTATNPTSYNIETATFTLNNPTRTGYTFAGWTGSNGTTPQTSVSVAKGSTGNKTYTANWTANKYNVVVGDQNVEATYDAMFPNVSDIPTMDGYTFFGYYDAENEPGTASPSGTRYTDAAGHGIHTWDKTEDDVQLYAYFTKDMTVTVSGYEGYYDANAHSITLTMTDPEDGYVISLGEVENVYPYNTLEESAKTDVDTYSIYIWIEKSGYTDFFGGPYTIKIKEVDKTALTDPLATDDAYYNNIKDAYSSIASDLKGVIDNIKNNIRDNANVTAADVAKAVVDLQTALSEAKIAVTKAKIDAIGSGKYDVEAPKIQDARDYYDDELTADEQEAVTNYQKLLDAEALYGPVGEVVAEINDLQTITDLQAFKTAVQTARDHYDALLDDQKDVFPAATLKILTDSEAIIPVVDEINALGAPVYTDEFKSAVSSARNDFDKLTKDQKDIFPASVLKVLEDDEAIVPVMDIIMALGQPENSDGFRTEVETARERFDDETEGLTQEQQALVPQDVLKHLTDREAVIAFMDDLNNCAPVEDSADFREAVEDARGAYDALSADQKGLVPTTDLNTLTGDEAIVVAMDLVAACTPIENTQAFRDKASAAKAAYDALTDGQKDIFPSGTLETLQNYIAVIGFMDAVNAIGDLEYPEDKKNIDKANELIDSLTNEQKELIDGSVFEELADIEKAYEVLGKIEAIGTVGYTTECKQKIDEARDAYNALDDTQKELVTKLDDLTAAEETYAALKEVEDLINDIPTPVTLESKEAIDAAREAFDALTEGQQALVDNVDKLIAAEVEYVKLLIDAIGTVEYTEDSKDKIDAAKDAFDALTDDQKALLENTDEDTLAESITTYEVLHENHVAAQEVIALIDAIGEVEYTEESKAKIDAAMEAFDALTDEQKAIVDKYLTENEVDEITVSETIYIDLGNQQKAKDVKDLINAIGVVAYPNSRYAIEAARTGYNGLTETQKTLVDNYETLTAAEVRFAELEKTPVLTGGVIAAIVITCLWAAFIIFILVLYIRKRKQEKK